MNEIETVDVVETQNNDAEVTTDAVETVETKVETPKETPEQKVARLQRELKRARQKAGFADEEAEEARSQPKGKPFTLGLLEKGFLNANGIKGQDEYELVTEIIRNTGKTVEDVIDSKYFASELKDLRQMRESKMASDAASGSKRGMQSAQDTVDYWLAKGPEELPPKYMTKLRREVVNARASRADNSKVPFL